MAEPVRLQRYLAAAGVAARRKAEELITAGRVTVNGAVVTVLGTRVDPEHDAVEVDGEAVVALDHFYVLFNKPKGCITAVTDDRGRPTVMDYLLNLPVPVKPVGRLDFYSEGVLLLTNDGELAARLLAPASHVPKTYHVKVHGRLDRADLAALRGGVTLDDGTTTLPAEVEILPGESKHTWLGITIHEGKHRQIHRMIEALGYQVDKLQRVAFANLTFHELRVGDARELTQPELNELRDSVGLDHAAVARGRWRSRREETDIPRRARAKERAEEEAVAPDAPAGQAHPSEGAAIGRDAPGAPIDRTPDAGRPAGAPAPEHSGRGERSAHGERPGEPRDSGRDHGKAASERGEGGGRASYGHPASERGASGQRASYGKPASERGASGQRAYGKPASERGASGQRPAYGNAADRRGEGDRGAAYGKPASERGASGQRAAYGKPASERGARGQRASYGKPASERGASGQRASYGKPASERGASGQRASYGKPASERGASGQRAAYSKPASERGVGGRRAAYGPAASERGGRRAYGSASERRAAYGSAASERGGQRAAYAKAPDERRDRGPRAASGTSPANGSGIRRSSEDGPRGSTRRGFGPRVPRRGRPPK